MTRPKSNNKTQVPLTSSARDPENRTRKACCCGGHSDKKRRSKAGHDKHARAQARSAKRGG